MMRVFAAALLAVAGCAAKLPPGSLDTEPRTWTGKDWHSVRGRWEAHGRVRHEFDLALDADANYLSWDLRAAMVAKVAEARALTEAETEAERSRQLEEVVKYHDFVVTAQSHDYQWANLAGSKDRTWTIGLVTEDGRVQRPLSIKRMKLTSELKMLFPHTTNPFALTFMIRFPATPDGRALLDERTQKFTLRFAGAPGKLDLGFKVAPAAD